MISNLYKYFIREKHKRYSPDPITGVKQRKRKHKRKSLDIENPEIQSQPEFHRRITIKVFICFFLFNCISFIDSTIEQQFKWNADKINSTTRRRCSFRIESTNVCSHFHEY